MESKICASATAAVGVLTALVAAGCVDIDAHAGYVDREERRYTVQDSPDVSLSTFDGSIEVRSWDRPEVLVVIEKRARDQNDAKEIEIVAEQKGNRVSVEARNPRRSGFHFYDVRRARLIVSVPQNARLTAASGDGSIDVAQILGRVELRSGDGRVRGHDLAGDIIVETGDGSIRLDAVKGAVDATTGDGSIVVEGALTRLRTRTGDGSVRVRAEQGSAAGDEWNVSTGDGSITLELPQGFGGELDAHTGDGRVVLQDVTLTRTDPGDSRHDVRGTLGNGGSKVRVRTGDGSITVRRF
jgi:DUF4097 and DUF4098 domain-containing protein YvlB